MGTTTSVDGEGRFRKACSCLIGVELEGRFGNSLIARKLVSRMMAKVAVLIDPRSSRKKKEEKK